MAMVINLEKLGLSKEDLKLIEGLVLKPHGIIFVTGPTGSGKTTTLYSCLNKINCREKKIITIEDPIEYDVPGMIQIQVMPDIGLTFAKGLRAMLRHDPDIMMVGEVRDLETAEIAIRVALTGHLVFSTLHTNDASSGVTRLIDIGVEPYLVASSVEAFIAQRLVRSLCSYCKQEDTRPLLELREKISHELKSEQRAFKIYKPQGCQECNYTGFHGRTAIFEVLILNDTLKNLVLRKPSSEQIKKVALSYGMRTLRQDGWRKVIEGVTTPEEIINITEAQAPDEIVNEFLEKTPRDNGQSSDPEDKYIEKRLFLRVNANVQIYWKTYTHEEKENDKTNQLIMTKTQNISAGGLLFITKKSPPVGEVLELTIDLPQQQSINCLARVLRVDEVEQGTSYRVAVCFLDLSGSDRARLNAFAVNQISE
jgi:Tfp pilus assembly pilus retraction ATPase PilT